MSQESKRRLRRRDSRTLRVPRGWWERRGIREERKDLPEVNRHQGEKLWRIQVLGKLQGSGRG